jgi:ABC-2 type transport system ATP-binding protein
MNNIIEIHNLSKKYPQFFLDNINLDIPYGKIIGLIGENGAGKTTLLDLILNQRKPNNGYVKIFGLDNVKDEKKIKKDIGFVVDECCFHACFNSNNIKTIMKSIYTEWDNAYFDSMLDRLGLNRTQKIKNMSKGMKSKLMLAIALSHNPHLLILDEITSGLDPVIRDDVLSILKEFINDNQRSVFFSTHITSDLDKIADYVAFIHKGSLVFMEPKEQLRRKYLLIRCTESDYSRINQEDIVAQYKEGGQRVILITNRDYYDIGELPTIDDIMLLNIKGRAV